MPVDLKQLPVSVALQMLTDDAALLTLEQLLVPVLVQVLALLLLMHWYIVVQRLEPDDAVLAHC